jgi:hypothetical protein
MGSWPGGSDLRAVVARLRMSPAVLDDIERVVRRRRMHPALPVRL